MQSIESIGRADAAINKDNQWVLENFRSSILNENNVEFNQRQRFVWQDLFSANFLQSMTADPFKLPVWRLQKYINYLDSNRLDSVVYQVALYKRIAVPATGLAMILLALPLIFRPRQLGGIGQRLFLGIVMALLVYVLIEAVTNGAVVYRFSPLLAAFFPPIVILGLAALAFKAAR